MVEKKSNVLGVNFSDKAIEVLKKLNVIDGKKKSRNRMLSRFISERVIDYLDAMPSANKHEIELRILKKQLFNLQKERDVIEERMSVISAEISKRKELI